MVVSNQPRVSAIIPAYNCESFLAEAIESVLAQTRPVDEIVVIDDGSTDATPEIAKRYADRGVRYVHQKNQGAGAARNRGIAETSGEYLAFLDGDDLWLPEKTAKQYAFLQSHPEIAMVGCYRWAWNTMFEKRTLERFGVSPKTNIRREIVVQNVIGNPSMILIRREAIQRSGGFNPALRWAQDWDFFIRIVENEQVAVLPEPLMTYRWHMGGLTNTRIWDRLNMVYAISQQAILRYRPLHERPFLLLRALSQREYDRGVITVRYRFPMLWRIRHAIPALLLWPWDKTKQKVKLVGRAFIGHRFSKNRHIAPVTTSPQ